MTGTWATAEAGCPITASVSDEEGILFVLGDDPNRLDLAFDQEALTRFLSIAHDALAEFGHRATPTAHDDGPTTGN